MYEDEVIRTKYDGYYVHRGPLELKSGEESDSDSDSHSNSNSNSSSEDDGLIKV